MRISTWLTVSTLVGTIAGSTMAAPAKALDATTKAGDKAFRLKTLEDPKLTPPKRANLALRLYRDEMVKPTPRPKPPYTDYKTHDYALAQITRKLVEVDADLPTLKRTWQSANPGEVKDSLAIYLLCKGQKEAKEPVTTFILNRQSPMRLRELAAEALGRYAVKENDTSIGQTLAQVIREDSQGQYKADPKRKGGLLLVYPVRKAAAASIKKMDKAGMLLESYVTAAAERVRTEVSLAPPVRK